MDPPRRLCAGGAGASAEVINTFNSDGFFVAVFNASRRNGSQNGASWRSMHQFPLGANCSEGSTLQYRQIDFDSKGFLKHLRQVKECISHIHFHINIA